MPNKEDAIGSRATKVKTEQGSDDKNNVKKTGFQQRHSWQPAPTSPEDTTGAMFSPLGPATFKKTIKRLSGFATLNYGHYTVQAVRTHKPKTFSRTTKLSDDDISNDTDGAKYCW